MSLFDVIRYPISDPPTAEQLEAIPDEIFSKWSGCTWFGTFTVENKNKMIGYYAYNSLMSGDRNDLRRLRKIIEEHNVPI